MQTIMKFFLPFLAFSPGLAITWTRIGCDDAWSVQLVDGQTPNTMNIDIDAVWTNANDLSSGARASLESIKGSELLPSKARKNAGANAEFIWNLKVSPHKGLRPESDADVTAITSIYTDVEAALAGTLAGNLPERGYIFCQGRSMQRGRIPGLASDNPVWYATVTEGGPGGTVGTTDFIIPRVFESAQRQPCTEQGAQGYLGKTFYGRKAGGGPEEEILGVVLCPNQFRAAGVQAYATLDQDYPTQALGGNRKPYIAFYNSLSGTLLHEMVHVVGHSRDPTPPPAGGYHDKGSGFREQYQLARGLGTNPDGSTFAATNDQKIQNPDGYRLFAEMCRSPSTTWGYPNAPPAS